MGRFTDMIHPRHEISPGDRLILGFQQLLIFLAMLEIVLELLASSLGQPLVGDSWERPLLLFSVMGATVSIVSGLGGQFVAALFHNALAREAGHSGAIVVSDRTPASLARVGRILLALQVLLFAASGFGSIFAAVRLGSLLAERD